MMRIDGTTTTNIYRSIFNSCPDCNLGFHCRNRNQIFFLARSRSVLFYFDQYSSYHPFTVLSGEGFIPSWKMDLAEMAGKEISSNNNHVEKSVNFFISNHYQLNYKMEL